VDGAGYDGQLYYFLALDPANARSYMDSQFTPPAYRYTRIVYPLAARLLALGQPRLVPYALIALNWLAVGAGTLLLGLWLRRRRLTPWLALLYALCPGTFAAVGHDLAEPLAFAFVALAVVLYDARGPRRWLWAGLAFAAAALTRETTAVFALVYGAALAFSADGPTWRARLTAGWRQAVGLLAVALGPLAAYEVFLRLWLGPSGAGLGQGVLPDPLPYHGLLALWPWSYFVVLCFLATVPSALVCLGMAAAAIRRRAADVAVWALLANALLFSVWLGSTSYADPKGAPRYTLGIVVAALFSLPALDRLTRGRRGWLVMAAVFWLALLPLYVLKNG
jgi:hypothetical protein